MTEPLLTLPITLTPLQLHDVASVAQEVADARAALAAAQARYQEAEARALLVLRVYAELVGEDPRHLRVDSAKGAIVLDVDAKQRDEMRKRLAAEASRPRDPASEAALQATAEALSREAAAGALAGEAAGPDGGRAS